MESKTKTKISEGKIKELVVKNFGQAAEVTQVDELHGGMMNTAYLISYKGSVEGLNQMVLKVSSDSKAEILTYESQIMRAEVQFYKHMDGKPIPIPKLIKYDFSHNDIDCDYFFISKVEGQLWQELLEVIDEENANKLKYELGRYNAVIHSVKGEYFGYIKEDKKVHYSTWADAFQSMVTDLIDDGKMRAVELPYDEIAAVVNKHVTVLNEIKEPTLVNFDMWAGNVFLKENAGEYSISAIIDFERSFYGDPYADFIASMMIYDDVEKEAAFIKGYNELADKKLNITDNDRVRMNLYRLYMALILAVETYRYDEEYGQHVFGYVKMNMIGLLKALSY
ncbi:MAG: phosphotransferase family protein [Lachnospiraceae bacterium]